MGQGTSNQSFLLFIATCTFVGPQDLICKGQVCPGQVSGAFDFTLNCVVPVPQIWGIINSIAPTAAFFFFSITTYFALSATVSVLSLWPFLTESEDQLFSRLETAFFTSLDCCFDLGFGGFPNIGRHQQICLQEVAADVGRL